MLFPIKRLYIPIILAKIDNKKQRRREKE